MELHAELDRAVATATGLAGPGEEVAAVIPTEPEAGVRVFLCAYAGGPGRAWAAVDGRGALVTDRQLVRAAVSIAALCELAEESAGGGKLEELRRELVALRLTENPEGIEEAEAAALDLERTIQPPPRLASPGYLDALGAAVRRLELSLGESMTSPFAEAMKQGSSVVSELELEVETGYKGSLT
jgi:hypothetical protein